MPDLVTRLPTRPARRLRNEALARPDSDTSAAESAVAQETLLRRVQSDDPEGWRLLLELYGPVVHSWCRRWGLQAADVADVAQDVFCALMRRIDHFHPSQPGGLRGWIWTITQNKLRDHRRKARLPRTGRDCYEQLLSVPQPEPPEPAVARAPSELFHRVLLVLRAEFEERTWLAFWRSVIDEQTSPDIGRELDMTANAVRQARARVLQRLRQALADSAIPAGRGTSAPSPPRS
jgi:RNA polymerase sigma-70 factor (ECF subfamily)